MSQLGVRGVHHVSINVRDAEEALRFYVDVLGFVERIDRPDFPFAGAWLDVGAEGQQLHLLEVEGVAAPAGQHFAVGVDDLDEAIAAITERGVEVSAPTTVGDVARQAFLKDPTGNLVELNQQL
ncbi:MAG: VOC family protein [Actinomycetota bacterium]